MKELSAEFKKYLSDSYDELISLTYALCAIPSPSHHEEKKAEFCKSWLSRWGIEAHIDPALNVVWPYHDDGGKLLVVSAHTDTVFPDTEPFSIRFEGTKACCPSIGDDTLSLAALMMYMKYVALNQVKTECGIIFVCNSCEEGLGNLKGIRQIFTDYGSRVANFMSLDGDPQLICNHAVGSTRYRISIDTEGGHSFGAFGHRNAIEKLSRMIAKLYDVQVPVREGTKTTYNVGGISGGTSVNTIAQHAEMLYEYRSDCREFLNIMKENFERIVEETRPEVLDLKVEVLGERPCAGDVDQKAQEFLNNRAFEAMKAVYGQDPEYESGSTDCNIPLSMGIPSICFGMGGVGAHTREEYVDLATVPQAYELCATVLNTFFAD